MALGAWVVLGALVEAALRVRAFRAPWGETARRAASLPRGAWGMTRAHIGLGVFALGSAFEGASRAEGALALQVGQTRRLAAFELRLERLGQAIGPNYEAARALIRVTDGSGRLVCEAAPERRLYAAGGQTLSRGGASARACSDDVYVVAGDARLTPGGAPALLIKAYWNPWVRFVFAGPLLMALGGLLSLSDRRLRFAVPGRARQALATTPAAAPAE